MSRVVTVCSREDAQASIQYGTVGALSQVPGASAAAAAPASKGADGGSGSGSGSGSGGSGALESLFASMSKIYLPTFVANETWPDSALTIFIVCWIVALFIRKGHSRIDLTAICLPSSERLGDAVQARSALQITSLGGATAESDLLGIDTGALGEGRAFVSVSTNTADATAAIFLRLSTLTAHSPPFHHSHRNTVAFSTRTC